MPQRQYAPGPRRSRDVGTVPPAPVLVLAPTPEAHHDSLTRVALGVGGILPSQAMATWLNRVSGGRLSRVGSSLLQLQRQYGNRYVQQVVASARQVVNPVPAPVIQPKLEVGAVNDKYEREADRVAQQMVGQSQVVQRRTEENTEPVRDQPVIQRLHSAEGGMVDADVQQAIQQARGGGQSIPRHIRAPLERVLGADFSGVRIHRDARTDQLNHSLQARAFTTGQDIFFRKGEYTPGSSDGHSLLAHELTHVVQQRGAGIIQRKPIEKTCSQHMERPLDIYQNREWIFRTELTFSINDYFRHFVRPEYEKKETFEGVRKSYEEFDTNRQQAQEQFAQGGSGTKESNELVKTRVERMIKALDTLGARLNTLSVMEDNRLPFKDKMATAIQHYNFTIDEVRPYIEAASQTERDSVWQDKKLMALAKSNLDLDTYLALLPALRVFNPPTTQIRGAQGKWTSHLPAQEADRHISTYLGTLGVNATAIVGRKVEGEVSIVDDADWKEAFLRQWGQATWNITNQGQEVNAFVDVNLPKRHIWLHKDRGDAGTIIHEGMHKYADPTLRDELIQKYPGSIAISQLDEGITEYFTREITLPLGISRSSYRDQYSVATQLVSKVGQDVVAKAYFEGKFADLKKKLGNTWDNFAGAVEAETWSAALRYL